MDLRRNRLSTMEVTDLTINKVNNIISQVNNNQTDRDTKTNCNGKSSNTQPSSCRKRQNSEATEFESKKLKTTTENTSQIPKMGESELFLFSAIQNLANNINVSFNILNEKMNQLESNIEEKISLRIQSALKTQMKEEVGKMRQDIQQDIDTIHAKVDNVQKCYDDLVKSKVDESTNPKTCNIVIRNLEYDAREKDENQVTLNKVQCLFKDGMTIPDVKIKSVARKGGNENRHGIIVVELEDSTQKKTIFSKKKTSKKQPFL